MAGSKNPFRYSMTDTFKTKENIMNPRIFKLAMTALTLCGTLALAGSSQAYATGLPFSDGIVVGNTLYIAGQQGADQSGKLVAGGIGPQTRAALETIETVVKKAGFQMSDVVAVNVYLADIHDFAAMNEVYKTFFPNPKPTRTTVQVAALVNGARIEISAIAVRTPGVHFVPASHP